MSSIALVAGELTAYLTVNKDDYTRGLRDAKSDLNRTGAEMGRDADRIGRDSGGKLAQGMRQSIIRNSPLIAAAVGGALAAGAPAAIAGAGVLFGGIGAVAAAQSVEVRRAWTDLGHEIRDGAVSDAQVLIPALTGMADDLGASFQRLRPQLRDAFEATAPLIDTFTDGLTRAAENAMPGLVRAVQSAGPVFDGLADLMADIGTGLTGFFDAMSTHAPAAGKAFAAIGDILEALLPTLGELLGQGAELAAIVLPPLASALGVVADVARALGPALPAIAAGFIAMKAAQSAATFVGGLGDRLETLRGKITPANAALGAFGVAAGLYLSAIQDSDRQTREWADALNEGGAAADRARAQMEDHAAAVEANTTGLGGLAHLFGVTTGAIGIYENDVRDAEQAHRDWLASLTPIETAQRNLRIATDELSRVLDDESATTAEVAAAQRDYERASREAEAAQGELEQAIHGVTAAMVEQANQALAAANAQFGYEQAVDSTEQSLADYTAAVAEHGATSEEASDAARALSMDMLAQAEAAGRAAQENSGLGDSLEGQQVAASATLAELYRLRTEMGSNFPPALQQAIRGLEQSGAAMQGVSANAVAAKAQAASLITEMFRVGQQRPTPVINMNTVPFMGAMNATLANVARLHAQRPTPVAYANVAPAAGGIAWLNGLLSSLNARRANPQAILHAITGNAEAWLNYTARNRTSTVFQYVQTIGHVGGRKDGGPIYAALGAKVVGPGGPRDDLVRAFVPNGPEYRLSAGEWIINALRSAQQGDRRMRALNEGRADIVMRGERRANGGRVSAMGGDGLGGGGNVVNINLNMSGVDFSKPQDRRRVVAEVHAGLREYERALA